MIKRLFTSRGAKKFRRNKRAMFALSIIAVYAVVFFVIISIELVSFVGSLSSEGDGYKLKIETTRRVLPGRQRPGAFMEPSIAQREENLSFFKDNFELIFAPRDPLRKIDSLDDPRLEEAAMAERDFADVPLEELQAKYDAFAHAYEDFDNAFLDLDEIEEEEAAIKILINNAIEDGDEEAAEELREELVLVEQDLPEYRTAYAEALKNVEEALNDLYPIPTGLEGTVYWLRTCCGTDSSGRSIFTRGVYSIKIAFQIGLVVAGICVVVGTILGAAAGFLGTLVDSLVLWIVSVFTSIPYLVLLAVVAFMFVGSALFDNPAEKPELQLFKLYVAMGLAFWTGTCRVVRGEVLKIKQLEYVQAATAIGFGKLYIMFKHVIPNTVHLVFINFSLLFIGAIKSEVILTFLGLGVSGQVSWGSMIANAKDDVSNAFFWELGTAGVLMFILVLAFNIVSDALQDAFDPKHVD